MLCLNNRRFQFSFRFVKKESSKFSCEMIINLRILPLLLTIIAVIKATSNIESNNGEKITRQAFNKNRKLKLSDLNDDVLLLILDYMNELDLLQLAQVNSLFGTIATESFRHRYKSYKIQMEYKNLSGLQGAILEARQDKQLLIIRNYELFLKILKHFGSVIKRLQINRDYDENTQNSTVFRYVNEYASESLNSLELMTVNEEILSQFTKPFDQVEDLELGDETKGNGSFLSLNEVFPRLRRLSYRFVQETPPNYTYIDCEIPNLEHFEFFILGSYDPRNFGFMQLIEGFLRKNSHIRSIQDYSSTEFLKIVTENLPNLENLTTDASGIRDDAIHFQHLKHLTAEWMNSDEVNKLSCSRLETLSMLFGENSFASSEIIFRNNQNLRSLELFIFIGYERERDANLRRLNDLLKKLPNLTEVTLRFTFNVSNDVIIRFAREQPNWTKFTFISRGPSDLESIYTQLQNEWRISEPEVDIYEYGLMLERI